MKKKFYPYSFELETTSTLPKLPSIIATEPTVIDNYAPVNVYPYYMKNIKMIDSKLI